MHSIEWLWDYLDCASKICIACSCKEFYNVVAQNWKNVEIPDWIPINDENLMPILICSQNIETLKINFPFNIEEEKSSDALIMKLIKEYQKQIDDGNDNNNDDIKINDIEIEKKDENKKKNKKVKRIKYPAKTINPSYLPHLKNISKIDFKSCGSNSYSTFILAFILHLSKFVTLKHLCLPQLFTTRHNCISILDIHQLQIGFDGMNVHLGADLIGITHLKKHLPSLHTIYCDELYLFIGEDIYKNHEKSGKQYWVVMNKYCNDVGIKIHFRINTLTIMLMPRGHDRKTPPLIYQKWDDIKDWLQERLGDFIQNIDDEDPESEDESEE